jgi:carbonic anhydrase
MTIIHNDDDSPVGADEALARLMAGNERFLRGEPRNMRTPMEILADLAIRQRPFATILGCSDSRVPPELIFDAGFGDLFIIRVAGNIVSPEVMGSLQYAGMHLKTQLFVVLGHEGCGAVQAALAAKFQGAQERPRIQLLLQNLLPGLEGIDPQLPPPQQLACAVEANVR